MEEGVITAEEGIMDADITAGDAGGKDVREGIGNIRSEYQAR